MGKQKVIIGSTNPVKINSVKTCFLQLFPQYDLTFQGIKVPSGVSNQPMTSRETLTGAMNRAERCKEEIPDALFWVGPEGGVEREDFTDNSALYASSWVVIIRNDGLVGKAKGGSFQLPPKVAKILLEEGKELGEANDIVFKDSNSKQKGGAIGALTNEKITRTTHFHHAITLAAVPFISPVSYKKIEENEDSDYFFPNEIRTINQMELKTLELRLKPLRDKYDDLENWRYRSKDGFIGENEDFLNILKQDKKLLSDIGWTNVELCDHLENIIKQAKDKCSFSGVDQCDVKYNNFIYHVSTKIYAGAQYSPFYNNNNNDDDDKDDDDGDNADDNADFSFPSSQPWNEEYEIRNSSSGAFILIGGDIGKGVLNFLRHLGFCEGGGVENPYRLEPILAHAIITGDISTTQKSLNILEQRKENILKLKKNLVTEALEMKNNIISETNNNNNNNNNEKQLIEINRYVKLMEDQYQEEEKHWNQVLEKVRNYISNNS